MSSSPRSSLSRARSRASSAFTLVELLIATTVGVLLVTATASTIEVFGNQVGYVRAESDTRLERALLTITDRVRDGWWVESPAAGTLEIADPYGNLTTFVRNGSKLDVVRPSGATGALLSSLSNATFSVETMRRLRDLPTVDVVGTWFSRPDPGGATTELVVKDGDALAVGFRMSGAAPESARTVSDVDEERLSATFGQIVVALSFLDGSQKQFCHLHAGPPHNPSHPGYVGRHLYVDLHEARAPDDGRPYGPALGSIAIPAGDLPATNFIWWDPAEGEQVFPPDAPGGGTGSAQCEDEDGNGECDHKGKDKHKNPLDTPGGVAWGWWNKHEDAILIFNPTSVAFPIDLSALGVAIEPGQAYTLVLSVSGWDEARIQMLPTLSGSTGVALQTGGGDFVPQMLMLPMDLVGSQTCTQTAEHAVVSRVTVTLATDDGRSLSGSASVSGQAAVSDPWRGVVPDQLEVLEL